MILLLTQVAAAEGYPETPHSALLKETVIYIDIVDMDDETITLNVTGDVTLTAPDGTQVPSPEPDSGVLVFDQLEQSGIWKLELSVDQENGFDFAVMPYTVMPYKGDEADELLGRVYSKHWQIKALSDSAEISPEFYVPVPSDNSSEDVLVFRVSMQSLSFEKDAVLEVMANQSGGTDIPSWSIPEGGTPPVPELPLYFSPPTALELSSPTEPSKPSFYASVSDSVCDDNSLLPGYTSFQADLSNNKDSTVLLGCYQTPGSLQYSGGEGYTRYWQSGSDEESWEIDWFDDQEDGYYICTARKLLAPIHVFVGGASGSAPGISLDKYFQGVSEPAYLQWNDSLLVEKTEDPNKEFPVYTSNSGLESGSGSAHGWNPKETESRGDRGWVNTWTFADVSEDETFELSVLSTADEDTDLLPDIAEECLLETNPKNKDTDADTLNDADEVGADIFEAIDTDKDGIIDALDEDDDGDEVNTLQERNDTQDANVDWDVDGDGLYNWHDTDADGDDVPDGEEQTDADSDGIIDYLDPEDEPTDTDDLDPDASPSSGSFTGGAFRCSAAPFAVVSWPLFVALLARRRRTA